MAPIKQESTDGHGRIVSQRGLAGRCAIYGIGTGRVGLLQHVSDWALYAASWLCVDDCVASRLFGVR